MSLSTRISISGLTCLFFSVAFGFGYAAVMSGYNDCRNSCIVWSSHCASNDRQFVADIFGYGVLVSFILSIVLPVIVYRRGNGIQLLHITAATEAPISTGNFQSAGDVRSAQFWRLCSICTRQILYFSHKLLSLFVAHPIRYMTRLGIAALAFGLGVFVAGFAAINISKAQADRTPNLAPATIASTQFCKQFNFHWLELVNAKFSNTTRHVEVFMDEKAFSEDNLRELFEHLSKTNPDPAGLTVVVFTDWSQFTNPSVGCPGGGCGECKSEPFKFDHLQATYWRRPDREYFRYSPKINTADFKKVVIK
jgi:hypothetical protein